MQGVSVTENNDNIRIKISIQFQRVGGGEDICLDSRSWFLQSLFHILTEQVPIRLERFPASDIYL